MNPLHREVEITVEKHMGPITLHNFDLTNKIFMTYQKHGKKKQEDHFRTNYPKKHTHFNKTQRKTRAVSALVKVAHP